MRHTEFWERMNARFGAAYSPSVVSDQVLSALGNRTPADAIASGVDLKAVWLAVCDAYEIPERQR